MTSLTDHLTKLMCAAHAARSHGYSHTGRAFDRMIADEKRRLLLVRDEHKGDMRPKSHEDQLA